MATTEDLTVHDLRLMQELAQQVFATRPEFVNNDATVGELAWVWGRGHAALGDTWRRRLWYHAGRLAGWGWLSLPRRLALSDGSVRNVGGAYLTWQVHPDRPELLDDILDWCDAETSGVDRRTTVRAANEDALDRLSAHGYFVDSMSAAADDGHWTQFNTRDLTDLAMPGLPTGFRFRTADEVGPEAAVRAHRDAWHPSTLTVNGFAGVRPTWPYRGDLHILVEAPDGTLASSTIMWLDEGNRTAEFEPVGTHQGYRRRGLGKAMLLHGMHRAREAGATRMLVACLGATTHKAARGLYYGVGFRELSREVPHMKPAV